MSSAHRGDSPARNDATDDSESGSTAEDSGGEDDVYSDLEYSRVVPTPATDRRRGSRSTPKTPTSAARTRNQYNETPTAARQSTRGTTFAMLDRNGHAADTTAETQTQKVMPVTATQLQRLGLGMPDTGDSQPLPETSEHSQDLGLELETDAGPGPEPTAAALEHDSDELPDVLLSDDERVSSGSEELGTPRVAQLGSGSYGSGGMVDETPMRIQPFNASQYIYVLCLWQRKWYPARADLLDYEEAKLSSPTQPAAAVIFGDGSTDTIDLKQASEFDLQVGDRVQVERPGCRNKKFEVVHLISDDSVVGPVRTTSGHSRVRLRLLHGAAKSVASSTMMVVDVGELSLTKADYEVWTSVRSAELQRRNAHALSPTDHRLARLVRNKRQRKADLYDNAPSSRRRRVASSREHSTTAAATAATAAAAAAAAAAATAANSVSSAANWQHTDLDENKSDAAGLQESQIFSNCVFSISMSDQADEESEQIKQLITSHGGTVLNNGLSDLVKLSEATESGDMPGHDPHFGDAEFAAVLAEKPRRTIKYLEMLAVGWPCLMSGFVKECIHQGAFIDWVPWALPAGVSSVPRKAGALVNANIAQFHHGWLRSEKLATQFMKRRVILKCTIPICVAMGHRKRERSQEIADAQRLFLASLCAPQYKLWVYKDRDEVPIGSLLLQLGENKGQPTLETDPSVLYQMKNLATADEVVVKDAAWLLECIINGELI